MTHFERLEHIYRIAPINEYFAPTLTVTQGEASVRIDVRPDFHHTAGAMHGLVYFKALDDAAFFAANSIVEDVFVLTARFEIEFLKPVVSGTVTAKGRVVEEEGHRIIAAAELLDDTGVVVGRGQGHFARSRMPLTGLSTQKKTEGAKGPCDAGE